MEPSSEYRRTRGVLGLVLCYIVNRNSKTFMINVCIYMNIIIIFSLMLLSIGINRLSTDIDSHILKLLHKSLHDARYVNLNLL